jgi:glycosyltransferase involved in cell wall biosynthesis
VLEPRPTPRPFAERSGALFVGAFHRDGSPNADSVAWFVGEILPLLRARIADLWLTVAGAHPSPRVLALSGEGVEVLGRVDDLVPLYDQARLFVAPTRFAAGVPYKCHHAAAHGVPIVCTSLLAAQLGWRHDVELLVADEPGAFAEQCHRLYTDGALWSRLREAALARVAAECGKRAFDETLAEALRAP